MCADCVSFLAQSNESGVHHPIGNTESWYVLVLDVVCVCVARGGGGWKMDGWVVVCLFGLALYAVCACVYLRA